MAVDEQRLRIRKSLEEKIGLEETAYLVDGRPPGGWGDLVTKEYLDLRLEALEHRLDAKFRDQTTLMVKWFVPTIFVGMSVSSAIIAAVAAALA